MVGAGAHRNRIARRSFTGGSAKELRTAQEATALRLDADEPDPPYPQVGVHAPMNMIGSPKGSGGLGGPSEPLKGCLFSKLLRGISNEKAFYVCLFKAFSIRERVRFTFRAEAFNV